MTTRLGRNQINMTVNASFSSDSATVLELAELNNEGAHQLSRGNVAEATAVFEDALMHVRRVLQLVEDDDGESPIEMNVEDEQQGQAPIHASVRSPTIAPNRDHSDAAASSKPTPQSDGRKKSLSSYRKIRRRRAPVMNNIRRKRTDQEQEDESGDYFFLYDIPMRVHDRYNVPDVHELCLYVTFNLALSLHLSVAEHSSFSSSSPIVGGGGVSGMRKRTKSERATLKRAAVLYKLAYSLHLHWEIELSESHSLALWNNMAHVFKVLGREPLAQTSLQHMLTMLLYTVFRGRVETVDQLDDFMVNVLHLVFGHDKRTVVAAAA
jgi:hypothetical protein